LGAFFAKRLLVATALACGGTLAAGLLVDHPLIGDASFAYALAFIGAGLSGFASSYYLARTPEPPMPEAGPPASLLQRLRAPIRDDNFRSLLILLGGWNLATNLAA